MFTSICGKPQENLWKNAMLNEEKPSFSEKLGFCTLFLNMNENFKEVRTCTTVSG